MPDSSSMLNLFQQTFYQNDEYVNYRPDPIAFPYWLAREFI